MATITKEKVRKINEGCTNGWKLNVEAWVGFNNKVLVYEVPTEDVLMTYTKKNGSMEQFYVKEGEE